MSVHSKQLAAEPTLTATAVSPYVVPAGKRTILKCVVTLNRAAAANVIALEGVRSGTTIWVARRRMAATNSDGECDTWQPWIVMNAGDVLRLSAGATSVQVVVSGTELDE